MRNIKYSIAEFLKIKLTFWKWKINELINRKTSGWVEHQNSTIEETIDILGLKSEKFIQNDTYGAKRWKIWKRDYETWRYHIGLFVVQEEEEGENRIGTKFGDIIVEDFLEVMKYTHSWIQKSENSQQGK